MTAATCSSCRLPARVVVVIDNSFQLCPSCVGRDLEPKRPATPTAIPAPAPRSRR